jgi:outer membrane protein assembly factor BamB
MKKTRIILFSLLLILTASFLSGCTAGSTLPSGWPGLLVNENTGYLANNEFVYAINLENGNLKWKYPADKAEKGKAFYASPVLTEDGQQLIVGGYDHVLYSLDPNNGTVLWTFPVINADGEKAEGGANDRYIASPLVTSEGIFAPNADGFLYALDLQGNQLWPPFKNSQPLWAQPVTDGKCQCMYVSSMDHTLYAVDTATGEQIWQSPDLGAAVVASPTYDENGTLFVGTFGNEMLALDSANGNILWRASTTDWVWSSAPQQAGTIYFGDIKKNQGTFYALTTSGNEKWQKQTDGSITGAPLLVNDQVFFGTEAGSIYAMDLDGNPAWNTTVSGRIYSPILNSGDTLFVTPAEGDALLIAMTNAGSIKWSFVPPK